MLPDSVSKQVVLSYWATSAHITNHNNLPSRASNALIRISDAVAVMMPSGQAGAAGWSTNRLARVKMRQFRAALLHPV